MEKINSPESMIAAIRHYGIIPFFKCGIPGYSIEEMTDPDFWFTSSENLGPWDWKISVIEEGDIAYGKFMGGKAAFATVEFYAHLMNYRRSLRKYQVATGAKAPAKTRSEILMKHLAPAALAYINENGAAEAKEIRGAMSAAVSPSLLKALGKTYKDKLVPEVKKSISDSVVQFLEMGTWTVTGNIRRVYRGPNLEYQGWLRSSLTTPDALFSTILEPQEGPSWTKHLMDSKQDSLKVNCTPEESRIYLINHIESVYPSATAEQIEKLI